VWIPNLFVIKFATIDTRSTSSILIGNITSLGHEAFDDSMENVSLVMEVFCFVTSAKGSEVFSGLRNLFGEQFEVYLTS